MDGSLLRQVVVKYYNPDGNNADALLEFSSKQLHVLSIHLLRFNSPFLRPEELLLLEHHL